VLNADRAVWFWPASTGTRSEEAASMDTGRG
jgi:hypothetical protein